MLEFSLMFGLGLIGSLHCTQMCGPLVLSFSMPLARQPRRVQIAAQLAYHAGRLLTYSALGTLAGLLGSAILSLSRWESAAALTGGSLMIVAGLLMAGAFKQSSLVQIGASSSFTRTVSGLLLSPLAGSKFAMGLLLGLLPCGLIYAALLKAIAAGSAVSGALGMFAFGLGTALPLFMLGVFSATVGRWLGRWRTQLPAASVMCMGLFLLWRGLLPVTAHQHMHLH